MARYGQSYKERIVGRLLPPESAALDVVSREVGVSVATLEWVDWFNNRRLPEPIGNIPPADAETNHYVMLDDMPAAA